MSKRPILTPATRDILRVLRDEHPKALYTRQIAQLADCPPGSVHGILIRWMHYGWITRQDKDIKDRGKPRCFWVLTEWGYQQLAYSPLRELDQ